MRELSKEEIELINKMAQSYWTENNRTHIDNEEEWNLTRSLVEKLTIPNVSKNQLEEAEKKGYDKGHFDALIKMMK